MATVSKGAMDTKSMKNLRVRPDCRLGTAQRTVGRAEWAEWANRPEWTDWADGTEWTDWADGTDGTDWTNGAA